MPPNILPCRILIQAELSPRRAHSISGRTLRLIRRMAFFFEIRRSSLFETNQRLRRTVLRIPLLATFLRKRLSSASCDSFGRRFTVVNYLTSLLH